MTQKDLSELVGMHRVTLTKFENGQCDIMASHAIKLMKLLKIRTSDI